MGIYTSEENKQAYFGYLFHHVMTDGPHDGPHDSRRYMKPARWVNLPDTHQKGGAVGTPEMEKTMV